MGTTEGTIRNRRQWISRLPGSLLPLDPALVEYSGTGANQRKAYEIQLVYANRKELGSKSRMRLGHKSPERRSSAAGIDLPI